MNQQQQAAHTEPGSMAYKGDRRLGVVFPGLFVFSLLAGCLQCAVHCSNQCCALLLFHCIVFVRHVSNVDAHILPSSSTPVILRATRPAALLDAGQNSSHAGSRGGRMGGRIGGLEPNQAALPVQDGLSPEAVRQVRRPALTALRSWLHSCA